MDMLDVDNEGFDFMDRKLLLAVIDKFMGASRARQPGRRHR